MARRTSSRERDEHGVVAITVALLMVTVLTGFASFSLDIGYKRMASRDMQAVADIVAMDMARQLDGSGSLALTGSDFNNTAWRTEIETSLVNQVGELGHTLTVQRCTLADVAAADAVLAETGICAVPGILNADGSFSGTSGSAGATHVKVLTRTTVDYLLPIFAESGDTARSAIATAQKTACIGVGSYLMRLSSGESPVLNAVLGDALNTSVLSYDGLAGVNFTLLNLSTALGLGSPSELATANVTAGTLLHAAAVAVGKNTPQTSADISAISILNAAAGAATPTAFVMSKMLQVAVGPGAGSALGASLNALDLVKATAAMSDGDHFLNVPGLSLGISGVTNLSAKLHVVEGPQIYCGPTGGSTNLATQARVVATYELLGLAGVPVGTPVKVSIDLGLANAKGTLTSIDGCPTMNNLAITLSNQTAADLSVSITTQVSLALNALLPLALTVVEVKAGPTSVVPPVPSSGPHNLALPQYYTDKYHSGSGTLGLVALADTQISAKVLSTGLPVVSSLLSATLKDTLKSVSLAVNNTVLPTLKSQLGITVAGVDLWAVKPKSDLCSTPQLRA